MSKRREKPTYVCNNGCEFEKNINEVAKMDVTESSSSETSPAPPLPNLGDLSLEKDTDRKTLMKDLYDMRLRIYYMEKKEKAVNGEDGEDIYQKYIDLQTEYEKLSKNVDEKDDLLLKAKKVTSYLKEEKEKLLSEYEEKEAFYKEHIRQLEKEIEDTKLCNPKFGLHSTVFMSGDSNDSYSLGAGKEQKRINDLESQIHRMNVELETLKANNDQLEKTVVNLQRKLQLCNKEVIDLNDELTNAHRERDIAMENCVKNDELLNRIEKEKKQLEQQLAKMQEENQNVSSSINSFDQQQIAEQTQSSTPNGSSKSEKAAATLIRHLLSENKQMNSKLRKVRDELLLIRELCASCPTCVQEKKYKKMSGSSNSRSKTTTTAASTSEEERCDSNSVKSDSEPDQMYNLSKIGQTFELRAVLREKDKIIKQLRTENKKRTYNLQELVNKELWDKNREIEKLNKQCDRQKHEMDNLRKQLDRVATHSNAHAMRELQSCFVRGYNGVGGGGGGGEGKENIVGVSDDVKLLKEQLRACLEEKKALLQKIVALESKITSDEEQKAQTSLVNNLRLECAKHRDEFEEAEKARKDAFNACALLTNRLEELACFLESLLAHDASGLNAKRRELLRQAIERSREISKSFSYTFADPDNASIVGTKFESSVDLSAPILPDCSEINWSFSCADDDDDDVVDEEEEEDEYEEIGNRTLIANGGGGDDDHQTKMNAGFASTEESDAYQAKNGVLFVNNDLEASGEVVFCSGGGAHGRNDDGTATETTDDPTAARRCEKCCGANLTTTAPSSVINSSMPVSSEEAPKMDSESDVEKARRFAITGSGTKLRGRRHRPPAPCYTTDSDASVVAGKKYSAANETKQMQRRIQYLERINESLRKDLKHQRTYFEPKNNVEKTDLEKIREKTKLRNLLNKINLENCVDTDKYRDNVENIRRHLRDLSKYLKSKKFDKAFISAKLEEVSKYFELSELCCAKLNQHVDDNRQRCEVLTSLLEETQSKFEQVMLDLKTTKLAYNSVILEHEQNIFKYKQSELSNEQLREKLKMADESRRNLEDDLKEARFKAEIFENEMKKAETKTNDYDKLKELLEKASRRIVELETFVSNNDRTLDELDKCKKRVQKLTEQNEKLLDDLEEISVYKTQIGQYENQLKMYKINCEKLEVELFEKDTIEKLYKEQCVKLEVEIEEKNSLNNTLKMTTEELRETRSKIEQLETKLIDLNDLVREKENIILDKDCRLVELKNEKESNTLLLNELKKKTETEIAEKVRTIDELKNLLVLSEEKTKKFEFEIDLLKSLLNTCEEEKREFRTQIETQVNEYERLKKQHEQKMKHLLTQIVAYRTEEESSLAAHRQLVEQIEEAQHKKELWRKSIQEWKEKYEQLKKEKDEIEEKLKYGNLSRKNDSQTLDRIVINANKMDAEVNHLENIKSQLENRVYELETANKELENRLQHLQTHKISPSDFDLTSGESSRATSPTKKDCPFDFISFPASDISTYKSGTTTTGYSSSMPSSPNRVKCPSPLTNSVPGSPHKDVGYSSNTYADVDTNYDDVFCNKHATKLLMTPLRKSSEEGNATSPDLGIDSDHGRNNSFDFDPSNDNKVRNEINKLEDENKTLKRELGQTKKELEDTLGKLTTLNKNKKKMEKAIFRQIFETKHILQRARVNLEDGSTNENASS